MNKKLTTLLMVALMLALTAGMVFTATAQAQGRQPGADGPLARLRQANAVLGKVTAVSADSVTIETRKGESRSFLLDDSTRFTDQSRAELSVADVKSGNWIAITAGRGKAGAQGKAKPAAKPAVQAPTAAAADAKTPLARLVVILPAGFDPEAIQAVAGEVTAVSANGFTVETRKGEAVTVVVNAGTKFNGQVTTLDELEVGMSAAAVTQEQSDGSLLAYSVRAGTRPQVDQRFAGRISAVSADSLTLQTRQGDVTIALTDETVYRIRGGSADDLKKGMLVIVGVTGEEGSYTATVVSPLQRKK